MVPEPPLVDPLTIANSYLKYLQISVSNVATPLLKYVPHCIQSIIHKLATIVCVIFDPA